MTARRLAACLAALLIVGASLVLAGCGGDADESPAAAATAGTAGAKDPSAPPAAGDGATTTADQTVARCGPDEQPDGFEYSVADLPADDPDGGLVVTTAPGAGNPRLDVLPSGTVVVTVTDPARCAVVADGGVWWEVARPTSGSDPIGWVNSRHLTRSAEQEAARRAEVCRLYAEVLDYRQAPDFAPEALTTELATALDGPPPGVLDALARISSPADEADLAEAYDALTGYVGPICP